MIDGWLRRRGMEDGTKANCPGSSSGGGGVLGKLNVKKVWKKVWWLEA